DHGPRRRRLTPQSAQMLLAGWPTARVSDGNGSTPGPNRTGGPGVNNLVAGWSTPSARDWKDSPGMSPTGTNPGGSPRSRPAQLPRQAALALPGTTSNSSPAPTENSAGLNPALARWLQGYPVAWCQAAIRASRKRRPP